MIPLKTWTNGTPENNYQDGTQLDAADFESWHKELLAVLTAANINPDSAKFNQILAAIQAMSLAQTATAFTSAGAAPNFTLAPAPALAAYAAGVRYRVKFNAAGNGADTLNVSGLGAKSIKQYNSAGAKVAAVIVANQLADVEFDGVDFVILDPLPGGMAAASVQTFTATGTIPATVVGGTAIINSASASTQTLPAANTVSAGKRIEMLNIGAGVATVSRAGADTVTVNSSTVTTLTLGTGDTLTLESNGTNGWYAVGGSAQVGFAAAFGASLATNGYQKMPSGLIIQWGSLSATGSTTTNFSFPIAFPTVCVAISSQQIDSRLTCNAPSTTGSSFINASATTSVRWIAIGY